MKRGGEGHWTHFSETCGRVQGGGYICEKENVKEGATCGTNWTRVESNFKNLLLMSILVENLSKKFGKYKALDHVNLEIQTESLVALVGASGSGKSTLLRIIAGLEKPDQGNVWLEGVSGNLLSIQEREIGFVFVRVNNIF